MNTSLDTFAQRRDALRDLLRRDGLPALLVSLAANRFYLSGFELHDGQCNETSGWLVICADGRDFLFTDPRFTDAAKRVWDETGLFIYSGRKYDEIGAFLKGQGISAMGFEPRALHLYDHDKLREHAELTAADGLVEELRVIKDEEEIQLMEASCALNHRVMRDVQERLRVGATEADVAWEVEKLFREGGATSLSFSTIVGVGPNAALPHAQPGGDVIRENSLVLIDCGGRLHGYCSDQTRTFWVGDTPSDRFLKVRDQVRTAQKKAIAILRPGLTFKEAYMAAWKSFDEEGVAAQFTHGLGHGVGLETHEPPRLSNFADGVLRPGMIVTVEPGLYAPDWGGVRWEHEVLITQDGCRTL